MEQVAAHVAACDRCREEVAQFRTLKAALSEMGTPSGSGDARERVFGRYREERPLPVESASVGPAAAAMRVHHWARHPALSFAMAAAAAALIAFLPPIAPSGGSPTLLPDPVEMSVLSERHDLHVAHVEEQPAPSMRQSPVLPGVGTRE